jgi:hypothetical protein
MAEEGNRNEGLVAAVPQMMNVVLDVDFDDLAFRERIRAVLRARNRTFQFCDDEIHHVRFD